MTQQRVQYFHVKRTEDDMRLDRWFKKHFPTLTHGRLEKLLRKGAIRLDGEKAKSNSRIVKGQQIKVPPMDEELAQPAPPKSIERADLKAIRDMVIYKDDYVIVINKAPGLAVQGGSGIAKHLDGMLDALRFDRDEKPRLVHRLDKDTSGALVLARDEMSARKLASAFQGKDAQKTYWGLVVGVPRPPEGTINLDLAKIDGAGAKGREQVVPVKRHDKRGRRAITEFSTVDTAGQRAAWVAMRPITGRTHQLRAHMSAIGTPLQGDGKYGDKSNFLTGISTKLHLHAWELDIAHPKSGRIQVRADLPEHMKATWKLLEFDTKNYCDPFEGICG